MWGTPPLFFQKLALEANEENSRYPPPYQEIADDEKHHPTNIAGFRKSDVSRAKPIPVGGTTKETDAPRDQSKSS
jgi:hypothetical protein